MKIKSEDPVAAEIVAVMVDGKRVPMAVELDTEEGWVDVMVPKVDESTATQINKVSMPHALKKDGTIKAPAESVEWEKKRIHGSVEVIVRDSKS